MVVGSTIILEIVYRSWCLAKPAEFRSGQSYTGTLEPGLKIQGYSIDLMC